MRSCPAHPIAWQKYWLLPALQDDKKRFGRDKNKP